MMPEPSDIEILEEKFFSENVEGYWTKPEPEPDPEPQEEQQS